MAELRHVWIGWFIAASAALAAAAGAGEGATEAAAAGGDAARGADLAVVCMRCHGPGGVSQVPDLYPGLAGRDADLLATLLFAYRDGEIENMQMSPQAQGLSDQEIRDLAAFFAAQPAE